MKKVCIEQHNNIISKDNALKKTKQKAENYNKQAMNHKPFWNCQNDSHESQIKKITAKVKPHKQI
jgi:hypothetical protein